MPRALPLSLSLSLCVYAKDKKILWSASVVLDLSTTDADLAAVDASPRPQQLTYFVFSVDAVVSRRLPAHAIQFPLMLRSLRVSTSPWNTAVAAFHGRMANSRKSSFSIASVSIERRPESKSVLVATHI